MGQTGVFGSSGDGINWHVHATGTTQGLIDVAYDGSVWVLMGQNNNVVLSTTDKVVFTPGSVAFNAVHGLAHDGSKFWACGQNGNVVESLDGDLSWINSTHIGTGSGPSLLDMYHDGTQWVTVGTSGVTASSPDSFTGVLGGSGPYQPFWDAGLVNGVYFALGWGGLLATSSDAIVWSQVTRSFWLPVSLPIAGAVSSGVEWSLDTSFGVVRIWDELIPCKSSLDPLG